MSAPDVIWIEKTALDMMLQGIKMFLVEVERAKAREAVPSRPKLVKGGRGE